MMKLNVRGTEAVERTLRDLAPKYALGLTKSTVGAVTSEVMKDAKRNMEFGEDSTGEMKRQTKKRVRRVRQGIVQNDIVVGKKAFYWRFHEYGQGVTARRMFEKAIMSMNNNLAQRFEELFMKKLVARLARERKRVK